MNNTPVDTAALNMRVARTNLVVACINLITVLLVFSAVVVWGLR